MDDLSVTEEIVISGHDLSWKAVRASGPGGQNVNKVATKVELCFDIEASLMISAACCTDPEASLMPAMFGICASWATRSGNMLTPVLEGML